jgi:hypothetical protein
MTRASSPSRPAPERAGASGVMTNPSQARRASHSHLVAALPAEHLAREAARRMAQLRLRSLRIAVARGLAPVSDRPYLARIVQGSST